MTPKSRQVPGLLLFHSVVALSTTPTPEEKRVWWEAPPLYQLQPEQELCPQGL